MNIFRVTRPTVPDYKLVFHDTKSVEYDSLEKLIRHCSWIDWSDDNVRSVSSLPLGGDCVFGDVVVRFDRIETS